MTKVKEITQDLLKELFDYTDDGYLIWRISPCQKPMLGKIAGTIRFIKDKQVRSIGINGKTYFASRLTFLWHKGFLPKEVDHEDGDCLNNKISNLRGSDRGENCMNRSKFRGSLSKYKGVTKGKNKLKWIAAGSLSSKRKHIGVFDTEEQAALAYNKFAIKYYGEFAKLNIIQPQHLNKLANIV